MSSLLIKGGLRTLFLIELYINRVFNIRYLFFFNSVFG